MAQLIISNLHQVILLVVLLFLSATFSGCETALFSLKNHDINKIRKSGLWVDSLILQLYNELPEFLLTILLGNMIVNILYFAVSTLFVEKIQYVYGSIGSILFGVFSFAAVLILGEITPKSIATVVRVGFARAVVIPIYYVHRIVLPVRYILGYLIVFFERIVNIKRAGREHSKEIRALLGLERKRGNINDHEVKLLESVIELPDIKVGEVLTARVDVCSVLEDEDCSEVIRIAKESGHNKIPVRSLINDEYIAWVDARDIFFADSPAKSLRKFYREFTYFSVYDRCDYVLDKFINFHEKMAFALDERGSSAGIIVLSDVLSELFGDFGDEESKPEEWITCVEAGRYILDGRLSLRDWGELFGVDSVNSRSNTIGGLITDLLGRSACDGDTAEYNGIKLEVLETKKRRIQKVVAFCIDDESTQNEGANNV